MRFSVRPFGLVPALAVLMFVWASGSVWGQDGNKLDPSLQLLLNQPGLAARPTFSPLARVTASDTTIDVFIRTTSTPTFSIPGMKIKSVMGTLMIASVPVSRLFDVTTNPAVQFIQAAHVWKPMLDASVNAVKGTQTRNAYRVTGKGVVVGIIDTGIDFTLKDFMLTADSTRTRVLYYWDMTVAAPGLPPKGFEATGGVEIDSTDINRIIQGTRPQVSHFDFNGHGTHVAGIAAGNGGGTAFVGLAPDADLIVVNATRDNASFSSADVITALQYINAKAQALGKPWVVNMSLGAVGGPADGTSAESQAIDAIVGPGIPRKAVVVAAGNDGGKRVHSRVTLNNDPQLLLSRRFTAEADDQILVQLWSQIRPNDIAKLHVTITGPDTTFGPVSGFPAVTHDQRDGTISVASSPHPYILTGSDIETLVAIAVKQRGTWTVSVRGDKGEGSGNVDMWLFNGNFIDSDGDDAFLNGQPASTKNAITVGSFVTKSSWISAGNFFQSSTTPVDAASTFSSPGPSRDGRQKPEISAPGEWIASGFSFASSVDGTHLLQDLTHRVNAGTSMAAPHVAGAIALSFQEADKRGLLPDAQQVRDALMSSADVDVNTGSVPNIKWGTGKLNVDAYFTALFGNPLTVQLASFTGSADGRQIRLEWALASETGTTGFQVYRSQTSTGTDREQITTQLITGVDRLSFVDSPPQPGTYYYWIADFDTYGRLTLHGPIAVSLLAVPDRYRLSQSRPNPFNPNTTIEYDIPHTEQVILRIYDTLGREVRTLVNARQPAGFHQVVWDGRNQQGRMVGSGVYLYTLTAGTFNQSKRMTLLK